MAPPADHPFGATPARERVADIDVLRGAALLGVLLVNLLTAFRVSLHLHITVFHTHPGLLNRAVDLLVGVLLESKAFALFSLLFGAGLAMQAERVRRGDHRYLPLALRRLLALLAIGLFHLVLIWNGDVLAFYAVCGLLVLPALWLPPRAALLGAVLLLAWAATPLPLPSPDWAALRGHGAAATHIYATGTYGEILRFRQAETRRFILPLLGGVLPRTMGLMLLGQHLWRAGVLRAPAAHRRLLRWTAGIGLPLGLLANVVLAAAAYRDAALGAWDGPLRVIDTLALALGYGALLLLLLRRPAARQALGPLAAAGRMALTNYLAQSVVLGLVFYGYGGYGGGLFGRPGAAITAPLGCALFALQLAASAWWLRRHPLGPAERLWRALSYGPGATAPVSEPQPALPPGVQRGGGARAD